MSCQVSRGMCWTGGPERSQGHGAPSSPWPRFSGPLAEDDVYLIKHPIHEPSPAPGPLVESRPSWGPLWDLSGGHDRLLPLRGFLVLPQCLSE